MAAERPPAAAVQLPGPTEPAGGEDATSTKLGARGRHPGVRLEDVEGGGPSEAIDDFYEGMGIEDSRGRMVRRVVPVYSCAPRYYYVSRMDGRLSHVHL